MTAIGISTLVAYGLFGALIGSFLNVVAERRGTGRSALVGRSHCDACGKTLAWYELVPVVSWVILRGRCGTCGSKLSARHIFVELALAALFAFVGILLLPLWQQVLVLCIVSLLALITIYDLRHTIIPDAWSYSFAATALVYAVLLMAPGASYIEWAVLLLSGPFIAMPLGALWLVSRGAWMGLGDVKLALGIGWLLGPVYGFVALLGAFVFGAVISVVFLLALPRLLTWLYTAYSSGTSSAGYTMKSEVPFGPFLVSSCLIVWFLLAFGIALPPLLLW